MRSSAVANRQIMEMSMLSGNLIKIALAGSLLIGAGTGVAYAGPDESIIARQTFMKERTKALRPLVAIMKGEAPYDPATVKASLATINAAWEEAKVHDPFAPDSAKGDKVETYAKPE